LHHPSDVSVDCGTPPERRLRGIKSSVRRGDEKEEQKNAARAKLPPEKRE
jgi:hypothetical protein